MSYDVSSLFTCIPTKDAITVISRRLHSDPNLHERTPLSIDQLLELLTFCLDTTYFVFNGTIYQQCHGAAMGSPISPLIANIYMEEFETKAIASAPHPPSVWLRYVDDTFVKIEEDYIEEFTNHINQQDPNIKFTQEHPVDDKLAFLDTCVHVLDDGGLKVTVYRKPTHTDQYLSFESHNPLEHKRSVVRTLLHRSNKIVTTPEDRESEQTHVKRALKANGYPDWAMRIPHKSLPTPSADRNNPDSVENTRRRSVGIPYCRGLSEQLQRVFKQQHIQVYHLPWNTLKSSLVHPKDKVDITRKCGVIYELSCKDCDSTYVGETLRSFGQRLGEHKKTTGRTITAVGEHCSTHRHNIDEEASKILASEEYETSRKVMEALYIKELRPQMNRDGGRELPRIYGELLSRGYALRSHVTSNDRQKHQH